MNTRSLALVAVLLTAVVMVSGCTNMLRRGLDMASGGECMELEEKIEEHPNMDCRCYPTDFVPEGLKNRTGMDGLTGKCLCTCSHVGAEEEVNVSVAEMPDGERVITTVS